jgi:hypothetical protein
MFLVARFKIMNKYIYVLYDDNSASEWFFEKNPEKSMSAVDLAKFITKETSEYPRRAVEKFTDYYIESVGEEDFIKLEYGSPEKFAAAFHKWIEKEKYSFKKFALQNNIELFKERLR